VPHLERAGGGVGKSGYRDCLQQINSNYSDLVVSSVVSMRII
jgi:hypothetical protein